MPAPKYFALAAALMVGGVATAAVQAAVAPLRLCADPANLPYSSKADKGATGLYVDIGRAVADALGRPMELVWSLSYFGKRNLRTTLLAGQCDLAVGLPASADFMGPRLIFSRPILELGYALVVPKSGTAARLDDLKGKRVAVQFNSPPQSLLALRSDIVSVTTMEPEEAMRLLAAGEVDAAFIWAPSAGYINRTALNDAFKLVRVDAPQMQFPAAIGFSNKQTALRDEVDAVLPRLAPRIRDLGASYAVAALGPDIALADAGMVPLAASDAAATPAPSAAAKGDAAKGAAAKGDAASGKATFNGTCAHCHGPDAIVADRKVNLRRLKVKYDDRMTEVFFTTVTHGRPAKGMPPWENVFKHEDFVNILAYLNTVQEP